MNTTNYPQETANACWPVSATATTTTTTQPTNLRSTARIFSTSNGTHDSFRKLDSRVTLPTFSNISVSDPYNYHHRHQQQQQQQQQQHSQQPQQQYVQQQQQQQHPQQPTRTLSLGQNYSKPLLPSMMQSNDSNNVAVTPTNNNLLVGNPAVSPLMSPANQQDLTFKSFHPMPSMHQHQEIAQHYLPKSATILSPTDHQSHMSAIHSGIPITSPPTSRKNTQELIAKSIAEKYKDRPISNYITVVKSAEMDYLNLNPSVHPKSVIQQAEQVRRRERQVYAFIWLMQNCTADSNSYVPRGRIFSQYATSCAKNSLKPLSQASLGKFIRSLFPNLKTRRLGMRGKSKYHYCGLKLVSDNGHPPSTVMSPSSSSLSSVSSGANSAGTTNSATSSSDMGANTSCNTDSQTRSHPVHGMRSKLNNEIKIISSLHSPNSILSDNSPMFEDNDSNVSTNHSNKNHSEDGSPLSEEIQYEEDDNFEDDEVEEDDERDLAFRPDANGHARASRSMKNKDSLISIDIPYSSNLFQSLTAFEDINTGSFTLKFPKISIDKLPNNVDSDVISSIESLYSVHCNTLHQNIHNMKFDAEAQSCLSIYNNGLLSSQLYYLFISDQLCDWICECDMITHRSLLRYYTKLMLSEKVDTNKINKETLSRLEQFCKEYTSVLANSITDLPKPIVDRKLEIAKKFSELLNTLVTLTRVSQSFSLQLSNCNPENMTKDILVDKINFDNLLEFAGCSDIERKETIKNFILEQVLSIMSHPVCGSEDHKIEPSEILSRMFKSHCEFYSNFTDLPASKITWTSTKFADSSMSEIIIKANEVVVPWLYYNNICHHLSYFLLEANSFLF
ncbi:hypothetical protein Kpol_457p14 [Vanderwaltozyma polyspora DSM 70294]|uniref:RFX-type winged-helix domain-containing protein n=1 Tax=Vanderwaltozyma polyspora (strain ATCC 22028 / DSM 70294 / BCRC 21397 / CBS 2163 / NBRC 10782 / NRRL Y-8283 / UCD 57-17) TaxID=436907 RepID=A7TQV5_VANPO|nr:uncharacterized protein Kpol_457p14 [Vanderwaltozyma polyspora DSM 70294]EDO15363.1 hypothetical protein Kpol_457p14 [Vanderwaltozyma polyspora DSM 70294]